MREAVVRRDRAVERRDQARQRAAAARRDAERLRQLTVRAMGRAEAIRQETEERLARMRRRS